MLGEPRSSARRAPRELRHRISRACARKRCRWGSARRASSRANGELVRESASSSARAAQSIDRHQGAALSPTAEESNERRAARARRAPSRAARGREDLPVMALPSNSPRLTLTRATAVPAEKNATKRARSAGPNVSSSIHNASRRSRRSVGNLDVTGRGVLVSFDSGSWAEDAVIEQAARCARQTRGQQPLLGRHRRGGQDEYRAWSRAAHRESRRTCSRSTTG